MKKILIIFILGILFIGVMLTNAHPGRTDKNGCHVCRTNCEKWGLEQGEYHCHNIPAETSYQTPINTYLPTPTITSTQKLDRIVNVTSIVDGDTIYIDYKEKVRFVGVNTPEIGEPGYQEAKSYIEKRIMGKQIYLDVDDKNTKDKYGRTLAVILIDKENLNKELLCKGYAEVMYISPSEFDPNDWKSSCPNISVTTVTPEYTKKIDNNIPKKTEALPIQTPKSPGFEIFISVMTIILIYLFRKRVNK